MYNISIFLRRNYMSPRSNKIDSQNIMNYKHCEYCGAPIPRKSDAQYCDLCRERVLFHEVRDYIRENDVNEFQVAAQFNIPLRIVKGWIREGRIEYKDDSEGKRTIHNLSCERCGAPVTFGTLCPKCLKLLNKNMQGYDLQKPLHDDDRMFYLNKDDKKK